MLISASEAANAFLEKALDEGKPLTQMQIQKLVYILHGWHLGLLGKPLVSDGIEAWQHGPFYRNLWENLREYGKEEIEGMIPGVDPAEFTGETKDLFQEVYDTYSDRKGYELSGLTHKAGTPWHTTYVEEKQRKGHISDKLIEEHFKMLAEKYEIA